VKVTHSKAFPTQEERFDEKYVKCSELLWCNIQKPVPIVHEFVEEQGSARDIVIDDSLARCNWKNVKIHRKMKCL